MYIGAKMHFSLSNHIFGTVATIACLTFAQPVTANDFSPSVTEDIIRETFVFEADETLKFYECTDEAFLKCTYVWGSPHGKDEARINAGHFPKGKKLMIIFAQGNRLEDFGRVTSGYSDAEPIDNLGIIAVWTPRRHQLSLMTETFLIIHVNIEDGGNDNLKMAAIEIANHVLSQE